MADQRAVSTAPDWRERVLTDPDVILEDRDVMRALLAANDRHRGENIVDMRGVAMERLEARLDRLEDTHRSVIAAAYENLAGTHQIHRCVLEMLEARDLGSLLDMLAGSVADIVRIDLVRLVLETADAGPVPHGVVAAVPPGFVDGYVTGGRDVPARQVTLRACGPASAQVFGAGAVGIGSEALLRLDLGEGRLGAMLAFGSSDARQFRAAQGTELLAFFASAFERMLRRHLA